MGVNRGDTTAGRELQPAAWSGSGRWTGGRARSARWTAREAVVSLARRPFIFGALVIFFLLYYYRPEDFIQPLAYIPMARITGGIAFLALLLAMLGGDKVRVPPAMKILLLLLLQETLCIPFA